MSAAREACPDCQLPFYTERNSECPYCGSTPGHEPIVSADTGDSPVATDLTVAGSVARATPPERPRTTCAHCGLPHYADDGNGCPYCDAAGVSPAVPRDHETTPAAGESADSADGTPREPESPAADRQSDRGAGDAGSGRSGGILASLRRLVGR